MGRMEKSREREMTGGRADEWKEGWTERGQVDGGMNG